MPMQSPLQWCLGRLPSRPAWLLAPGALVAVVVFASSQEILPAAFVGVLVTVATSALFVLRLHVLLVLFVVGFALEVINAPYNGRRYRWNDLRTTEAFYSAREPLWSISQSSNHEVRFDAGRFAAEASVIAIATLLPWCLLRRTAGRTPAAGIASPVLPEIPFEQDELPSPEAVARNAEFERSRKSQ